MNFSVMGSFHHLLPHEVGLMPLFCSRLDEIGKEEQLDDDEDDEKFDGYHRPKCFSYGHVFEPLVIEVENSIEKR